MNGIIQNIMDTVNKKGIQSNCRKILKKCSMKSAKDTGLITELAIAYREAGKYPVSDDELEMIIKELKDLLLKEK